ncbi:sorting nexin-3 isoform X1 [Chelonia mydas]|uniref:sorting nexin-3 isoform X1 n=1 Tax=Chelonia mydas TaxID=8469 RepID=UPI000FFCA987|nr:sorting nexin-3 isoform X1 [Chelonia mydas]
MESPEGKVISRMKTFWGTRGISVQLPILESSTTSCLKITAHRKTSSLSLLPNSCCENPDEQMHLAFDPSFERWGFQYFMKVRSTNLPIFKLKESTVRRRYSDFEWLRSELERESKVVVPPLPGKALFRQLPFRGDDGIFDDSFIEERKQGLEQFINKVAGHPLAQNERCLHMFLQDEVIDKSYTPSKIRHA